MRPQDWPERLAAYVEAAMDSPFEWGRHDCAAFAAGWIETLTGARPKLPQYDGAIGAARLMAGGMLDAVAAVLGDPMTNPAAAMRGDVVLVGDGDRLVLGVVVGATVVGPGADGLLHIPRTAIRAAWSV